MPSQQRKETINKQIRQFVLTSSHFSISLTGFLKNVGFLIKLISPFKLQNSAMKNAWPDFVI